MTRSTFNVTISIGTRSTPPGSPRTRACRSGAASTRATFAMTICDASALASARLRATCAQLAIPCTSGGAREIVTTCQSSDANSITAIAPKNRDAMLVARIDVGPRMRARHVDVRVITLAHAVAVAMPQAERVSDLLTENTAHVGILPPAGASAYHARIRILIAVVARMHVNHAAPRRAAAVPRIIQAPLLDRRKPTPSCIAVVTGENANIGVARAAREFEVRMTCPIAPCGVGCDGRVTDEDLHI